MSLPSCYTAFAIVEFPQIRDMQRETYNPYMYTSIGCSCWLFCFFFFELCSAPIVFHHLKDNTGERGMSTTAMATTKVTVPCRHLPRPSKTIHLSERQRLSALHTIQLLRRGRPVPSSLSLSLPSFISTLSVHRCHQEWQMLQCKHHQTCSAFIRFTNLKAYH